MSAALRRGQAPTSFEDSVRLGTVDLVAMFEQLPRKQRNEIRGLMKRRNPSGLALVDAMQAQGRPPVVRAREQRTRPRGRRAKAGAGTRDPPDPPLPEPEPGDAGLVVVPAEAAR
jgi:hypothetical protein